MLYDPKWEVQTKPAIRSLEGLIAWLEKQPAETTYSWYDIYGCVICNYLMANGFEKPAARPGLGAHTITNWGDRSYFNIGYVQPWTYGAALERARAEKANTR